MSIVNDNYPNKNLGAELTDEQLKEVALQQFQQAEVKKYNFPTEIIDLPSKGVLYPAGHPLASGKVEMKYMTAKEEDILTSQNLLKQGVVLDKLFQSMIVSPIKYNDLAICDKNAIMIAARILGYGKDYEVTATCPECGEKHSMNIDLTSIKEISMPEDANMIAPNRFKFTLPASKREVIFKTLTHGDDRKISLELDNLKKLAKGKETVVPELSTRFKYLIVSVDGNEERAHIENFINNEFFAQDSRALRSQIKHVTPDVDLSFYYECLSCGHVNDSMDIPIDTNFFWPRA